MSHDFPRRGAAARARPRACPTTAHEDRHPGRDEPRGSSPRRADTLDDPGVHRRRERRGRHDLERQQRVGGDVERGHVERGRHILRRRADGCSERIPHVPRPQRVPLERASVPRPRAVRRLRRRGSEPSERMYVRRELRRCRGQHDLSPRRPMRCPSLRAEMHERQRMHLDSGRSPGVQSRDRPLRAQAVHAHELPDEFRLPSEHGWLHAQGVQDRRRMQRRVRERNVLGRSGDVSDLSLVMVLGHRSVTGEAT
jgi:hypothetical protein